MQEKYDQGNDDKVNDPLGEYFGNRILTPKEFNNTYNRQWPTMERMIKVNLYSDIQAHT